MLIKILKILGLLVLLAVFAVVGAAWWFFYAPPYDGPEPQGRTEYSSLTHDDRVRTWQVYLPSTLADNPAALFVLHGSGGSGDRIRAISFGAFDLLAEREGLMVIYADGFENHWNDCRGGASYSANTENIDDVGFLRALVTELQVRYGLDTQRVYATGLSNGGHMAYRLGLEAPELVVGIAAIAANLPVMDNMDCAAAGTPVPTLIINGTEDPVNPHEGGIVDVFGDTSRGIVLSSYDTAAYWAKLAGATGVGTESVWPDHAPDDGTSVRSEDWVSSSGVRVSLISAEGGGHSIPNTQYRMPRIVGRTSHEFTAADVIWAFFSGKDYEEAR